ncbi:sensor histidine kinase [Micromonospora eburnea]|uniref:histidine kinase n=1 Tax=Micromonospora eburnea TaxID=227316 RepID=A0A1C6UJ59_9ACTN|nr:histidine kinase [Micromonospora eburnea]SCL54090.1 Signal transduction histidine kinase [Micromonospora eburnea]
MNERGVRRARIWPVVVAVILVVMAASFVFGLTARAWAVLAIGGAIGIIIWALLEIRRERARHEADLARWEASRVVLAERVRIARELHDIVSHGLGMITVRAATARHLHSQHPNQDQRAAERSLLEALDDVEEVSRQATVELRRMLQALRNPEEIAPRHPTENLESLPAIIADAESAGLDVDLDQPDLGAVSLGTQVVVCAVIREGLSNVTRHAGPTRVQVSLLRENETIVVIIDDEGPGTGWSSKPGVGHGLMGLRERIKSVGGTLEVGPRGSGYRLYATIPDDAR